MRTDMTSQATVADELLDECRARTARGDGFDAIFYALLKTHDLVNGGVVLAARGETKVRTIPLKGGYILVFDEGDGSWSLDRAPKDMR
jgi:hypothetical protein